MGNVLRPYKETLDRRLWPDVLRNQNASAVKGTQTISHCRKTAGERAGVAELVLFYCQRAAGFCNDVGYQNDSYPYQNRGETPS